MGLQGAQVSGLHSAVVSEFGVLTLSGQSVLVTGWGPGGDGDEFRAGNWSACGLQEQEQVDQLLSGCGQSPRPCQPTA